MNVDELRRWISAEFWKSSQVTAWAERTFYRRKVHQQTNRGTSSGTQPIVTLPTGYVDPSFVNSSDHAEFIADTVGAMVTGNTETGITVTYQDSDNTIDFVVAAQDHGALSGLADDDHAQYLLLAGRGGGQTAYGAIRVAYDANNYASINPASGNYLALSMLGQTGGVIIDIDPLAADGTSASSFRFFRSVNTSGQVSYQVLRGNGTNDVNSLFGGNVSSYLNALTGKVSIGITSSNASVLGVRAGTSSNDAAVGGSLVTTSTRVGNVGTGEDVLASYLLPANTLSANNTSVKIEAWGTWSGTNNIRLRLRFGTSGTNLVADNIAYAGGGGTWRIEARVTRTGAATQKGVSQFAYGTSQNVQSNLGLNQTLSGAITIQLTGEGTANNDGVIENFVVDWGDQNS